MATKRQKAKNLLTIILSVALLCALGVIAAQSGAVGDATQTLAAVGSTPAARATAEPTPAQTLVSRAVAQATARPTATPAPVPTPTPAPEAIEITLTAAGDVTLGGTDNTREKFDALFEKRGKAYFLENVAEYFHTDDVTIVNFEGTLTNSRSKAAGHEFNFKGKPEYVEILIEGGVEMASLANNHAMDYREKGNKDTKKTLRAAGIDYFDAASPAIREVKGVKIGCIGYYQSKTNAKKMISGIEKLREQCDILIVYMHWGRESSHATTGRQRKGAYMAVKAGADLVLGSHTHVAGGLETYEGVNIVYSMGNFCFGGNSNPVDKGAYMYRQTFTYLPGTGITGTSARIIPVTVSSVASTNDYRPTPATGANKERILKDVKKNSRNFAGEFE